MTNHASDADVASFGALVRRWRRAAGLTQEELAELAGITPRGLGAIESDAVRRPHRQTVERLASALHLTGVDRERFVAVGRRRPLPASSSEETGSAGGPGSAGGVRDPAAVDGSRPMASPAQLPGDVAAFTGRTEELAVLDRLLGATDDGSAVVISALSGTAGVGKTALAIRWAHRMQQRFPDGQLYVNLRGYDREQPMPPGAVLAGFLRALDVADSEIPLDEQERAAAYRTRLDGQRMLVLLDNAATAAQVRPLLPGSPGCLAIVTSRDSLAGLVAREGAHRIDVDLLPPDDAVALLHTLIGDRVDAEPEAATALAARCGRLPLALRIAAERAASRPTTSLSDLVAELWPAGGARLAGFDAGGDPATALGAVFSWSLRHLAPREVRAFHLLGLHPGPDHDLYAAAALLASPLEEAERDLDVLHRAHLLHTTSPGRYGMHDLLHEFAVQLNVSEDDGDTPHPEMPRPPAAMHRLLDFYLAGAGTAMDMIVPEEKNRRPWPLATGTPIPEMGRPEAARQWLDAERAVLVTVSGYAAMHGWHRHAMHLARTLFRYLEGHNTEALILHGHALAAARACGARDEEAAALSNLGQIYYLTGHYPEAIAHRQEALGIFQRLGDRVGQARTLANVGHVYCSMGKLKKAADHLQRAIALYREGGNQLEEGRALDALGVVHWLRSEYADAAACHERAVALARQTGDRISQGHPLNNLGLAYARQGRHEDAHTQFRLALRVFRETGYRYGEAYALDSLGLALAHRGRNRQAADYHQRALALFRELGTPDGEAWVLNHLGELDLRCARHFDSIAHHREALTICRHIGEQTVEVAALNGLGEALLAAGDAEAARTQHNRAVQLATALGDRYEQARAHAGLARVSEARGQTETARKQCHRALQLYDALAVPEADLVRQRMAALTPTQPS